jgi:CheY-like chemotaxis protein
MNILVLEDDPTRQQQFLHQGICHNVIVVDAARDAIRELGRIGWDLCFLDHDLGGKVLQASGPGTGFEVAEWIAENPDQCPAHVIVHSLNPTGATAMLEVLGDRAIPLTWAWTRPLHEIMEMFK